MQYRKKPTFHTPTGHQIEQTSQHHQHIEAGASHSKLKSNPAVSSIPCVRATLRKPSRRRRRTPSFSRSNLKLCLRLLRACRQRLKSDSAWTKFAFGRDVNGKTTHSTDPRAMRWCLVGTLKRTQRDLKLSYRHVVFCQNLLLFFINTEKSKSIICFNDTRTTTHKDVLSLLTLCISTLELRLKRRKDRSPVEYIQRGRGRLEKIVSNRQQEKEHPSP